MVWSAVPGRTYRIQHKEALTEMTWSELTGEVTAASSTASKVDPATLGKEQRYYRVLLVN